MTPNGLSGQSKLDALSSAIIDALGSGISTKEILTMLSTAVAEQETEQRPLPGFPEEGPDFVYDVYDELPPGMIDIPAAAEKYGVPQSTMRQWVNKGQLHSRGRLRRGSPGGGSHIVSEQEVLALTSKPRNKGGRPRKHPRSHTVHCPKCGELSFMT